MQVPQDVSGGTAGTACALEPAQCGPSRVVATHPVRTGSRRRSADCLHAVRYRRRPCDRSCRPPHRARGSRRLRRVPGHEASAPERPRTSHPAAARRHVTAARSPRIRPAWVISRHSTGPHGSNAAYAVIRSCFNADGELTNHCLPHQHNLSRWVREPILAAARSGGHLLPFGGTLGL